LLSKITHSLINISHQHSSQIQHSINFRIVESKNAKFPVGAKVFAQCGWRTHTVIKPETFAQHELYVLPDFASLPYSFGLSVLGMPGNTARFGFLEICQPKEGEIVVVTGAAGAVGSIVGQIAKIKGCKVIGFAGSDDKCKWLEDEVGFDKAINYKSPDVEQQLKAAAPEGIDCFFDNVGGKLGHMINEHMRMFGRISICGAISTYNDEDVLIPAFKTFHRRNLKMEGFNVHVRWSSRFMEGIVGNLEWVRDGKIKYEETVTDGFENMPQAFIALFSGANTGKAVVKV
jgi:prostaglandin reductase 1